MGATYKLKHKKADGTIEEVSVPISTVDGLQTALDGKQPSGSYVTTNTAQTISGAKTLNNTLKIQSGNPAGAFVLGGNVSSTGLTANTRKLGRMGVPAYPSNGSTVTSTVAGISFDAQANANYADFGGHPRNTSSIAPDVIRFVVADSHDNNVAGNRTLAFQIAKQIVADSVDGAASFAGAKFFVPVEATGTIKATGGFVGDLTGTADDADKLGGQLPAYYLDYNNLTNKPTIPSGSAEPFIVTFTNDGNDNYTADATYEDIEQAFANGKIVIGKDATDSYIYQIFGLSDDDTIPFSRIVNWGENGADVETLFVNTDDSVSYARNTLATTALATVTSKGLMSAEDKKKVEWLDLDTSDGHLFTIGDDSVTSARIELNSNDNSVNATGEEVYLRSTFGSAYVTSEDDIYLQAKGDIMANGKKVATTDMAVPFIPIDAFTVVNGLTLLAAKWSVESVNDITTPTDGMTIAVRTPSSGWQYGIMLSIDGGSNYYPIVRNKNTRVTSEYQKSSTLILTYNSTQTVSVYSGSSTQTTVTGCWQIAADHNSVLQSYSDSSSNYALLFSEVAGRPSSGVSTTRRTKFTSDIYVQPSTGTIYANDFVVNGQSIVTDIATTETAGIVKPDGTTIIADDDGTIHAVGGIVYDKVRVDYEAVSGIDYDDDTVYWDTALIFEDENGNEVERKNINIQLPILAGNGIAFTPNSDGNRMVISATGGGVAQLQQSVTYAELKALRDNGELVAGMQYRITDFVTTTSQPDTQSAGHPFDIIVTALSNTTLSENASADYHIGSGGGATFDPSVLADEDGNLDDGAVVSHYYVFEDFTEDSDGTLEGYKDTDGFIAYDYLENDEGVVVPVIYKTDTQGAIDSPEELGEPDYEDIFYYDGTMEVDGVTYDKWRKICETQENGPFWDGRTGYIWALTNVIVNSGSAVDPYFANSNLPAWEIKYCLDNDKTRFAWADEENGKGVIYYMKDEWDNECPYDFKNIQFKRSTDWFAEHGDWGENVLGYTPTEDKWFYTFTWVDENDEPQDLTLIGNSLLNDEGKISGVFGNKIGICDEYQINLGENSVEALSYNVFVSSYYYEDGLFYGCHSNTFGSNCLSNTFSSSCFSNTFGRGCSFNTFDTNCSSNTFSDSCHSNTFGRYCHSNTFGNSCSLNTFNIDCFFNTFGDYCYDNNFGNNFNSNTFGNGCNSNTFSEYARYNIFENRVQYVALTSTTQGNGSNFLQNITVSQGVKGTSDSDRKTINATRNLAYKTTYVAQGSVTTEV